jgi:Tfp pilus assembly protein PilX
MKRSGRRGGALVTAMSGLLVLFISGSAILGLSLQAMRRGRLDDLRSRALALADAGVEQAIHYLRTTAPDGTTSGTWRTAGRTETIAGQGDYTMVVEDGTGENSGKIIITSTGRATNDGDSSSVTTTADTGVVPLELRRAVRVAIKLEREDISVWNNAIFGGVGQSGRSIQGNVRIRGSVHLLGDGEPFTDADGDQRWDSGESYTDSNRNGVYNLGEPYTDTDGDGHRDPREDWDDVNGNGTRDPALTVTDLSSDFSGDANIGNNYDGMPGELRAVLPDPPTTTHLGESVETLNAKLRVKHGRVDISGSATVGAVQATGGSPRIKETMDGTYVSDGFGGSKGSTQVYSDNGTSIGYKLGNLAEMPTLTEPTVQNGVSYSTYMDYLRTNGLVISGGLELKPGESYGPVSDGAGNYLAVDSAGNITIRGIVYVEGDVEIKRNGGSKSMTYSGRGTFVSTDSVSISCDMLPSSPTFPVNHALGVIARRKIELATGGGDSQLKLTGAFYAQEQIISQKQNELAGTFVTSYFSMQNVPHMYQVPVLPDNLPPGMPGAGRIWIKTIRVDSWREVRPS